jgi:hypothetical protein
LLFISLAGLVIIVVLNVVELRSVRCYKRPSVACENKSYVQRNRINPTQQWANKRLAYKKEFAFDRYFDIP